MTDIYYEQPYLKHITTSVSNIRNVKNYPAICLEQNIVYPGGGGQPIDLASIRIKDNSNIDVLRPIRLDRQVYLQLDTNKEIKTGESVEVEIDWHRRYSYMKCHTATHVVMGVIRKLYPKAKALAVNIDADGKRFECIFSENSPHNQGDINTILDNSNKLIDEGREVQSILFPSYEEMQSSYPEIFRSTAYVKGAVRGIIIKEHDANPCGGTHVNTLEEIGNISFVSFNNTDDRKEILQFCL